MSSSYRITLDNWLKELDVKADKAIDIGGSQLPLPKRVKTWQVNEYIIADLPEPHADSPKPDIEIDINKEYNLNHDFDMVFCLEVFDYVWNPVQAFENIKTFMSDNAKAWVTFPFIYPTHNPIEDDSLRYTEFAIKKLAYATGLKIEEIIKRRPETNAIDNLWRAERMRAAKHYDHNVTGWIVRFTK